MPKVCLYNPLSKVTAYTFPEESLNKFKPPPGIEFPESTSKPEIKKLIALPAPTVKFLPTVMLSESSIPIVLSV